MLYLPWLSDRDVCPLCPNSLLDSTVETQMSDSNGSYPSGYENPDSICYDAQEVWCQRAREFRGRRGEPSVRRSKPFVRLSTEKTAGNEDSFLQCTNEGFFLFHFKLLTAAFWLVVPVGSARVLSLEHIIRLLFVRCSCRDGRGKDLIGKKSGRSRGIGKSEMTFRRTTKSSFQN